MPISLYFISLNQVFSLDFFIKYFIVCTGASFSEQTITRIDDEVRIKTAAFNETKQSHAAACKKDAANFLQRDLVDVLTPEKVSDDDFIETEHLKTVVAVVPS